MLPEIGSKISSFFGGSKEDENKESKVEVSVMGHSGLLAILAALELYRAACC